MDVVRKTCDLLEEEKRGVEEKLFQLEEEKQLVESHLQQQYDKLNEARTVKDGYWEREKMLHDTIEGIKEEMEKLSLLMTQK
jgi:butyrate kinase